MTGLLGAWMTVEIVEILNRADQGITRPFICRGENDNVYFVKGKGSGRRSQICELVAGHLARRFGLPIAPFEIVNVPSEIVALGFRPDIGDLGAGPAFGSCARNVTELTPSLADEVPQSTQLDVLAFDWWVRNGDRTLTDVGGNPNLFWNVDSEQLLVLDHNQAFDQTFTAEEFFLVMLSPVVRRFYSVTGSHVGTIRNVLRRPWRLGTKFLRACHRNGFSLMKSIRCQPILIHTRLEHC